MNGLSRWLLATLVACGTTHAATPLDDAAVLGIGTLSNAVGFSFTPVFVGSMTQSGTCIPCDGPYEQLVVVMSDDPTLASRCTKHGSYSPDMTRYHYLVVEALTTSASLCGSAAPIATGSYPMRQGVWTSVSAQRLSLVLDSQPLQEGIPPFDSAFEGTLELTSIGKVVRGTFSATSTGQGAANQPSGTIEGAFEAPACPGLDGVELPGVSTDPGSEGFSPCVACSMGTGGGGFQGCHDGG